MMENKATGKRCPVAVCFSLSSLFFVPISFSLLFLQPFEPFKLIIFQSLLLFAISTSILFVPSFQKSGSKIFWIFLLSYMLIFGIAVGNSINFSTALKEGIKQLCPIIFVVLILFLPGKEVVVSRSILVVIASGIVVSIYGIIQYFNLDPVQWAGTSLRVFSTLGQSNSLSCFLSVPIGLILGQSLQKLPGTKRVCLLLLLLFLYVACLGMTFTRAGWLALGVQTWCWFFFINREHRFAAINIVRRVLAVGLVILVGFGFLSWFPNREYSVVSRAISVTDITDVSIGTRLYLWETALQIIKDHPLYGVGPGNFSFAHLLVRQNAPEHLLLRQALPGNAHNEFLDIAVAAGIPGLLIYSFIWFRFFWQGIVSLRRRGEDKVGESLLLAGIGMVVNLCFIHTSTSTLLLVWWLWVMMELYTINSLNMAALQTISIKSSFLERFIRVSIAIGILVLFYPIIIHSFLSHYYEKQGNDFLTHKQWKEGVEAYTRAIEHDPLEIELWLARGHIFEEIGVTTRDEKWFGLAQSDFKQAIQSNPANPRGYANLGRLCGRGWGTFKRSDWYSCAIVAYREAVMRDPYAPAIWHDQGIALKGGYAARLAGQSFRECIKLAPSKNECALQLGWLYLEKGEIDKAMRIFHYAFVSDKEPIAAYWYAWTLKRKGEYHAAKKFLKKQIEKHPEEVQLRALLESIEEE